ncbi:sec-independent protein translocase protein [Candidatus Photodesmus katoptron]|uniref:twin-arginine translocase subunit TatC n=1 Tax=Candidatus Photodesmus anomalopis TaxID=28176 RepID=UPI0004D89026|nr:twin-arginine translocase subunit TatC [Candidatus Photodesmus katoptron]KEY90755.1 sec-independent protein translocase protein [Candidatus Photodesmus katoptron]
MTLFSHLSELRNRLLHAAISILVVFLGLVYFSNDIYEFIAAPLIERLDNDTTMIATNVTSPLLTPLKLTLVLSIFISIVPIMYQIWAFIAPSLYRHERNLIIPVVLLSTLLFYCGVAFAYFIIFPIMFTFFTQISIENVKFTIDISNYLDFVLALFLIFGVAFQIPVAITILCWTDIFKPKNLQEKRPYILVSSFVIGMLLTPPDIISQTLLAIPMYLLFEIGLLSSKFITKRLKKD